MKRAAIERLRTLNTWCQHLAKHGDPIRCACEFQIGRFRKAERVGGCGRSRCWLCHGDKLAGRATVQERKGHAVYDEGLTEIGTAARLNGEDTK